MVGAGRRLVDTGTGTGTGTGGAELPRPPLNRIRFKRRDVERKGFLAVVVVDSVPGSDGHTFTSGSEKVTALGFERGAIR